MPGFSVLLACIFGELMLAPIFMTAVGALRVARMVGAIVLLAALTVVGVRRAALVLFIPALVAQLLATQYDAWAVLAVAATGRLVCLCYVLGIVVWYVIRDRSVTSDTIAGAACVYMLFGAVWANLYQLIEHLQPGSFDIPSSWLLGPQRDPQAALAYFSFVTLATVGYGDIKPAAPGVGGLCVAEALVGQLYLAIMIARLVGLHAARRPS